LIPPAPSNTKEAAFGADLPLLERSTNTKLCPFSAGWPDIPEGRAAFAAQAQRMFARPEKHGLEKAGSVCHVEDGTIGGVP
jgi:hypothetical protein